MIESIKQYVINIAMYVILMGMFSVILPNNSFRKYIGITSGVIFMLLVMEPIKKGLGL